MGVAPPLTPPWPTPPDAYSDPMDDADEADLDGVFCPSCFFTPFHVSNSCSCETSDHLPEPAPSG